MATKTKPQRLVSDEILTLLALARHSDSVELKVTVPEREYRSTATALGLDPLDAQIRQVFFFDTPELTLDRAGVVARARRIQGRDSDSVIKLRPVVPDALTPELRASPNCFVELDAMPGGYVCSASVKGKLPPTVVRRTIEDGTPLRRLFSKEQRSFFTAHAPSGVTLDDLDVLGPIFVLKLKTTPSALARRLVTEMWIYPDGSRLVELSTKCAPREALAVAGEVRGFLDGHGLDLAGDQQTKTKTALQFFVAQLTAANA
jgi:hypothetical protein